MRSCAHLLEHPEVRPVEPVDDESQVSEVIERVAQKVVAGRAQAFGVLSVVASTITFGDPPEGSD